MMPATATSGPLSTSGSDPIDSNSINFEHMSSDRVVTNPISSNAILPISSPINALPVSTVLPSISPTSDPSDDITSDPAAYESHHVHQIYDSIAPHFSQTRYKPWPVVESFLRRQEAGSVGVDVGCGNGKYLGLNYDCDESRSGRLDGVKEDGRGGAGGNRGVENGEENENGDGNVNRGGKDAKAQRQRQREARGGAGPVFIIGCDRSQALVKIAAQRYHAQPTSTSELGFRQSDVPQTDTDTSHRRLNNKVDTSNRHPTAGDKQDQQYPSRQHPSVQVRLSHQSQSQSQSQSQRQGQDQCQNQHQDQDQAQRQGQGGDHGQDHGKDHDQSHNRGQDQGSLLALQSSSRESFGYDVALTQATGHGYDPAYNEDNGDSRESDLDNPNPNPNTKLNKPIAPTPKSQSLATVLIADSLSLPHPSHSFDFAICIAVIHHLASRERRVKAIGEILRVLRLRRGGGGRGRSGAGKLIRGYGRDASGVAKGVGGAKGRKVEEKGKMNNLNGKMNNLNGKVEGSGFDDGGGRGTNAACDERQVDSGSHHSPERECDGDEDKEADSENDLHQTQPQQDNPSHDPPNRLEVDRPGQALIFVWALEQKSSRRGWDVGDSQDQLVPWVLKADLNGVSQSNHIQKQKEKQGRTSGKSSNSKTKKQVRNEIGASDGDGNEALSGKDHPRLTPQSSGDSGKDRADASGAGDSDGVRAGKRRWDIQLGKGAVGGDEAVLVEKRDHGTVPAETSNTSALADEAVQEETNGPPGGEPQTFHRFYHLYAKGELEGEVLEAGGVVVGGGYERDNWWVVIEAGDGDGAGGEVVGGAGR